MLTSILMPGTVLYLEEDPPKEGFGGVYVECIRCFTACESNYLIND